MAELETHTEVEQGYRALLKAWTRGFRHIKTVGEKSSVDSRLDTVFRAEIYNTLNLQGRGLADVMRNRQETIKNLHSTDTERLVSRDFCSLYNTSFWGLLLDETASYDRIVRGTRRVLSWVQNEIMPKEAPELIGDDQLTVMKAHLVEHQRWLDKMASQIKPKLDSGLEDLLRTVDEIHGEGNRYRSQVEATLAQLPYPAWHKMFTCLHEVADVVRRGKMPEETLTHLKGLDVEGIQRFLQEMSMQEESIASKSRGKEQATERATSTSDRSTEEKSGRRWTQQKTKTEKKAKPIETEARLVSSESCDGQSLMNESVSSESARSQGLTSVRNGRRYKQQVFVNLSEDMTHLMLQRFAEDVNPFDVLGQFDDRC